MAADPNLPGTLFRFGIFEANPATGELWKQGVRLKIQEQPFQVLLALLERPRELVTREALHQRLWKDETFVDFDHSLNTAVNKLREALGDSAGSPRFIETLARRGYRFLAPVEVVAPAPAVGQPDAAMPTASPEVTEAFASTREVAAKALPRPSRKWVRLLFELVQLMYISFYVAVLWEWDATVTVITGFAAKTWFVYLGGVLITALVGLAVRLYMFSAVAFDFRGFGRQFHNLFPFVALLDYLWALAPLLLAHKIGLTLALAATVGLLFLPTGQRTLIRMAYER
jgi:DNA-binding winged helix-turn-helix (wHTH) protein